MGVEEGMKCSHSSLPLINHELSLKTLQIEPLSHCNFESIIFFLRKSEARFINAFQVGKHI